MKPITYMYSLKIKNESKSLIIEESSPFFNIKKKEEKLKETSLRGEQPYRMRPSCFEIE